MISPSISWASATGDGVGLSSRSDPSNDTTCPEDPASLRWFDVLCARWTYAINPPPRSAIFRTSGVIPIHPAKRFLKNRPNRKFDRQINLSVSPKLSLEQRKQNQRRGVIYITKQ